MSINLTVENLACLRGERTLFSGLHFALQSGNVLAIAGNNGSGKTSLLKILAGLVSPSSGSIVWSGEEGSDTSRARLAFIGHANAIKGELTVEENLAFWAKLYDTETLTAAALYFFGLSRFAGVPAGLLSSGWKRRLALSRLIVMPASLWLLDEPTSNLDEDGVALLASLIQTRIEQGGMVIATTHHAQQLPEAQVLHLAQFAPQGEEESIFLEESDA